MRKTHISAFIAVVFMLLTSAPSQANMPPPEPFKLGIAGKINGDGLLLTSVAKGSKAEEYGLKAGDVILGADKRYAKSMSPKELKELVDGLHHWRTDLVVLRGGREVLVMEIRA